MTTLNLTGTNDQFVQSMIDVQDAIAIQRLIETTPRIRIVSGEGEAVTVESYTGKRTVRAIKTRLTRERCGGDRWARAEYERSPGMFDVLIGSDE